MKEWTIEKLIPITITIRRVGLNFMEYGQLDRTRSKYRLPTVKECYLCDNAFQENDMLHLAMTNKDNKLICSSCAERARENGVEVIHVKKHERL